MINIKIHMLFQNKLQIYIDCKYILIANTYRLCFKKVIHSLLWLPMVAIYMCLAKKYIRCPIQTPHAHLLLIIIVHVGLLLITLHIILLLITWKIILIFFFIFVVLACLCKKRWYLLNNHNFKINLQSKIEINTLQFVKINKYIELL